MVFVDGASGVDVAESQAVQLPVIEKVADEHVVEDVLLGDAVLDVVFVGLRPRTHCLVRDQAVTPLAQSTNTKHPTGPSRRYEPGQAVDDAGADAERDQEEELWRETSAQVRERREGEAEGEAV